MPPTHNLDPSTSRAGKRRRLTSPERSSTLPSFATHPSHAISLLTSPSDHQVHAFHRRIQESVFGKMVGHMNMKEKLESDIISCSDRARDLRTEQRAHAQVLASSLANINTTLDLAANLTQTTRRLSFEAVLISEDVREFMKRYTALTLPQVRSGYEGLLSSTKASERPPEFDQLAPELFDGHLFKNLFEGIVYDKERDHEKDWQDLVESVPEGSNSQQIAASWVTIFETFTGMQHNYPSSFLISTSTFRTEILKIIKVIALAQLAKMAHIDKKLAELSERASRMREENLNNWRLFRSYEGKVKEVEESLAVAQESFPVVKERFMDHLLQLIILSKGP